MQLSLPRAPESELLSSEMDEAPSWAAVSFTFDDAFWCDWLFREFDGLRVPRTLIRRPSRHGLPYPDRLSISPDPADPVQLENYAATLRTAQHLIVVVSPESGRSELIQEQMRVFRAAGGEERIVAVVVKGEPGSPIAEPAALSDVEWMPQWLRWRYTAEGFAPAERTEPLVVDARLGIATLAEVRAQLLAAMLEVPEEQLSELGVITRSSSRPSTIRPDSVPEVIAVPEEPTPEESGGIGWITAAIILTTCCAIGGLILWRLQQDRSLDALIQAESGVEQSTPAAEQVEWKPGSPVVAVSPVSTKPIQVDEMTAASKLGAEFTLPPEADTREFRTLVERRDRLFKLAESRLEKNSGGEAFDILKQAALVAAIASRKSDNHPAHLHREAEIHRTLGQLSTKYSTPAEGREHLEKGRLLIEQIRAKGDIGEDGARLSAEVETSLKKLPR